MPSTDASEQLKSIESAPDFAERSGELVEKWTVASGGIDVVASILQFIEDHPLLDFGMPGPLVHFAERFYGKGYEQLLIESIKRKPTLLTAWMLNRVINGTRMPAKRHLLVETMKQALENPFLDQETAQRIRHFVERVAK